VPHVHPLLKDLTKGIVDHIVHRARWNEKSKQMEWRCAGTPRNLAKYPCTSRSNSRPSRCE
jgi:hypothetical protein